MAYDHGPGRREEHTQPHKIAGTVPGGRWAGRAGEMDAHWEAVAPDAAKPVRRVALRLAPEDPHLTDAQWAAIAQRYMQEMGYGDAPWEAVRHGADHIHITAVGYTWDGERVPDGWDYVRARQVVNGIEIDYGLARAEERFDRDRPEVSHGERESAARRGVTPERDVLREIVDWAAGQARSRQEFEGLLRDRGVTPKANEASTGRVSGYAYSIDGHADSAGDAIWWKGSQLGKGYAWARTEAALAANRERGVTPIPPHEVDRRADPPRLPSAKERLEELARASRARASERTQDGPEREREREY